MTPNQVRELIRDLQHVSRAERTAQEELIAGLEANVLARVLPLYERARRESFRDATPDPIRDHHRSNLDWVLRHARDLCDGWQAENGQYRGEIAKLRDTLAAIEGLA